jgi:hypothetical protein
MPHQLAAPPSGGWFHPSVRDVRRRPAGAARASTSEACAAPKRGTWFARLERWFWHMEQRRVERYLAQSADLCDLEVRMRALERGRTASAL